MILRACGRSGLLMESSIKSACSTKRFFSAYISGGPLVCQRIGLVSGAGALPFKAAAADKGVDKVCKGTVLAGGKQTQHLVFSQRGNRSGTERKNQGVRCYQKFHKIMFYKVLYKFCPTSHPLDSRPARA
jgi:hypothetical protein